jgi:hypothetical protein
VQDIDQLPLVTTDEDWLDLDEGERCVVRGKLDGRLRRSQDGLVVTLPSWNLIAIGLPGGYQGEEVDTGTAVTVVATRTEDGLDTSPADIEINKREIR